MILIISRQNIEVGVSEGQCHPFGCQRGDLANKENECLEGPPDFYKGHCRILSGRFALEGQFICTGP